MDDKKRYKIENAFFGLVVSVLIYSFNLLGAFSPVVNLGKDLLSPVQIALNKIGKEFEQTSNAAFNLGSILEQSDNFQIENIKMRSRIAELEIVLDRVDKQIIQNVKFPQKEQVLSNVRYMSEKGVEAVLDKGLNDGVVVGDIVVISNIPIGKVIEVGNNYSKITLLSSENIKIPAKITEDNLNVILQFDPQKGYILKDIPQTKNITKGGTIISTGVNSEYYYGLFLGRVGDVLGSKIDPSITVSVDYPINIAGVEEAYIVITK